MVYRDFIDISVAVSTPTGLVVPVLRNCQDLDYAGIEKVSFITFASFYDSFKRD